MSNAKDVAQAIVKSELWPGANPSTVLMLCYLAEAEGHHPAVVYRDYHIMQGKPSKKAEAILRDFSAAGGRVEWHALDDKKADATFHHPSGTVRIEWTLDRAAKAGLNTPMWKKYPRQMLRSRCISEGVRSVCPAATSGLYEESEVADIVAQEAQAIEHHAPVETDTPQPAPVQKAKSPANQETISNEQRAELMTLCDTLSFPVAKVLKAKRINDLRELPAASFGGAKKWINDQAAQSKPKTLAEELADEIAF